MTRWLTGWLLAGLSQLACAAGILEPEILATYPHDDDAFTQGLLFRDGHLYESTGIRRKSDLRQVEITTGRVLQKRRIREFGEGLAFDGENFVQLTWHAGTAYFYTPDDLGRNGSVQYEGDGWGLCHDGSQFVMSDGTSRLVFRNEAFAVAGSVEVTLDGKPLRNINELECIGDQVYANVYGSPYVHVIDRTTGEVLFRFDFSALVDVNRDSSEKILNGIAHDAESGDYYITGKLWPNLYRVRMDIPVY